MKLASVLSIMMATVTGLAATNEAIFSFPQGTYPQPFQIHVDQTFLDMTIRKVRDYRPTTGMSREWTSEGPPRLHMTTLAEYWSGSYDWRAVERKMNHEFKHYATTVPGSGNYSNPIPLHFIHEQAKADDAMPLLLLHGWPSTLLEWSRVVGPLSQHHGQAFHVVAPDLPGFGFSPAPEQPGLGPRELGRAMDELMRQLGYERYGIVTTDLGWFAGMWMVSEVEDHIIGHMSDFYISAPQDADRERLRNGRASDEETAYINSFDNWFGSHWGYATIHSQKPLALAQALADSPVGLLGWYSDVNHATSDGYRSSYEQQITDAMMMWIPGPYASMRWYLEFFKPYVMDFPSSKTPTGVTEWGWSHSPFQDVADFAYVPKTWIERTSNLVYFRRHGSGGHFPAVSRPEAWVEDVRSFFGGLHQEQDKTKDEL